MSTVDKYFEFVSFWTLLGAFVGAVVFMLVTPRYLRLPFALAIASALLLPAIMPGLGAFNAFAKGAIPGLFVLIALAALFDPAPRRTLPFPAWCYLFIGLAGFVYVWNVLDASRAILIRFEWVVLVLSALLTARVATDQPSLLRILRGVAYGCSTCMLLCAVSLVVQRNASFGDIGRFSPWGGNPLQVGLTFGTSVPIFFYLSLRTENRAAKPVWLFLSLLAACFIIIGVSRSMYAIGLIGTFPLLLILMRRPRFIIMTAVLLAIAGYFVFSQSISQKFNRILLLQDERWTYISVYGGFISERPIFGLLGTHDLQAEKSDFYKTHAHDAYLTQLYMGGFSYFLPLFALLVYSLWCAFKVWRNRANSGYDPLLISMLCCMLVAMYMHGISDIQLYFPAYIWTWLHIFIATFMMSTARELPWRRAGYSMEQAYHEPAAEFEPELAAVYSYEANESEGLHHPSAPGRFRPPSN